jgi:S-adenosylmethionine synthetase
MSQELWRTAGKGSIVAKGDYVFASESVSEGHPDKVCDRISDAVVDTFLGADPQARVACETLATTNRVVLAGEVRGPDAITADRLIEVARHAIKDIGYEQQGFHWQHADIACYLHKQSSDIAQGVDASGNKDEGAGDQGIMFGYGCRETPEFMPAPIYYAHAILKSLAEARHSGAAPLLGPDAKSQVSLRYVGGKPVGATSVVVSAQHDPQLEQDEVREIVRPHVLNVLPEGWMCDEEHFYVNPTGRFVIGGPDGDCGLTGRKIIVDTYGGAAPHGGGAFSGKDPTKVDRSAAYAARYLAMTAAAAGLAERCTIQLSMRSAWRSRSPSTSTPPEPAASTRKDSPTCCSASSTSARAAFAPISGSTSRSMHARRLTGISADRPRPMAVFPGSGSTSWTSFVGPSSHRARHRSAAGPALWPPPRPQASPRSAAIASDAVAAPALRAAGGRRARSFGAVPAAPLPDMARSGVRRRRASCRAGEGASRDRLHWLRSVRERRGQAARRG